MKMKRKVIPCLIIVMHLMFGCMPPAVGTYTTPTVENSTSTPEITVRKSDVPAISLTAVATNVVSKTSATSTVQTTKPPEEAKEIFLDLLLNNGECLLPCLLGMSPGKTSKDEFLTFYNQFPDEVASDFSTRRTMSKDWQTLFFEYFEAHTGISVKFSANLGTSPLIQRLDFSAYPITRGNGLNEDDEKEGSNPGIITYNNALQNYLLHNVLSTYGRPSQVLLRATPDIKDRPEVEWKPFSLVLYYPEKGFLIEYVTLRKDIEDQYAGCLITKPVGMGIATWSPEAHLRLEEAVSPRVVEVDEASIDQYQTIEIATSMKLEDFFQAYKDPTYTECIVTPKDLWPPI